MSRQSSREFISQAVIIVAVCVGAWMIFVQPKAAELARHQRTLAEQQAIPQTVQQATIETCAARITKIKSRVAQIQAYNRLASDSPRLYGLIMELASQHDVTVKSLQPAVVDARNSQRDVTASRIELHFDGRYENVAAFVQAIQSLEGFVRPASVRLSPAHDKNEPLVSARAGFDVLSFKIADALTLAEGATHETP